MTIKTSGVDSKGQFITIMTAFRRLACKYQPDVSTDSDAENRFQMFLQD